MKKYILYTILLFAVKEAGAQNIYDEVAEKIQRFYNQQQPDSIFNLYSSTVKEKLPLEKNRAVFTGLHVQFGDLKTITLIKQDTGFARYKAIFADQTLTMVLALGKDGLIDGFRFIPYNPEPPEGQKAEEKSNIILKTARGNIYGSLLIPEGKRIFPVVLIIAGSGPTDRNGNQSSAGIQTNMYAMLADSLFKKGIASVRYDKRGIGESAGAMGSESDLVFEDYINDAAGFIRMLKSDGRFSKMIVLGHSEGSLIGMIAAVREQADAYISIAGAGENIDKIIERQLKVQSPALAAKATAYFDSLGKGYSILNPDETLLSLFRPSVQPFLRSWMKYNPVQEIKKMRIPVLIIQGTTDLQVSVQDAQWLKAADPNAKLVLIDQMNHVLKQSGSDKKENLGTYNKPGMPLKAELVKEISAFIQSVNRP